jgi:type II secretory pathway component PulF
MNDNHATSNNRLRELLDQARARLRSGDAGAEAQRLQSAITTAETTLTMKFAANHPQLASSLRELADLLGKAGI